MSPCPLVLSAAAPETTVGMSGTITQLVLPGTELEPVPIEDRKAPVVVRVVNVFPHGNAFRYDLEYYGLEPGTFDLKTLLRRKDGTPVGELPSIPVTVTAVRPPGQVLPNALEVKPDTSMGGYRVLQWAFVAVWSVGLLAIVYFGFLRSKRAATAVVEEKPLSLADRLKPLVDGAVAGTLPKPQLAALERTLIAYWRTRLKVDAADPAAAMNTLRTHAEAGPLLEQLEVWLHHPNPDRGVDVPKLLAPYRALPADAVDLSDRGAA